MPDANEFEWEAYYGTGAGWSVREKHLRPGYEGRLPVCSMPWWQFDVPGIFTEEIVGAKAKILAASPKLLAACEALVAGDPEARSMARQAIAEARATS